MLVRHRMLAFAALAFFSIFCFTVPARAADAVVPPGGGLLGLSVHLDATRLDYGVCATPPCALTDHETVRLTGPDLRNAKLTTVAMDGGKRALWVHVPGATATWDAILVGRTPALSYAQTTGLVQGQPGGMTGEMIQVVPQENGTSYIARGTINEAVSLCGRTTLLEAQVLDPQSLQWKGASFQRLSKEEQEGATAITATTHNGAADKPLAPLLSARAASSGNAHAISDLDPTTVWSEGRSGIGRGEFVIFQAPSDVPLARLAVTIAPPSPPALPPNGAAPKSFYLATASQVFEVTLPEDAWRHPGVAYDIALPQPIKTSCLALSLGEAYMQNTPKPDVSIAELWAYSELDGADATLAKVAIELGRGGHRADLAAGILKRSGDAALGAVAAAWDKLDPYGRTLAIDVGEGASCGSAATQLFLRGLCDADHEVAHKAETGLQRCGKAAQIVDAVKASPGVECAKVPTYLALLARAAALPILADRIHSGSTEQARADARHAFATAAQGAPKETLALMIGDSQYDAHTRLEMLRAIGPRLPEIATAMTTLEAMLGATADFPTRYLALEPLAALAKAGDRAAATRVGAMLAHDPEWPVRAHAAELSRDLPAVQPFLVAAIEDKEPRVRQGALDAIAELRVSPAAVMVEKALVSDPWTFVRVGAARALGAMTAARDLDKALADALATDTSPHVRRAIIDALAAHHARGYADALRARLDDEQELVDVRAAAARALGAVCEPKHLDRLTELARSAADPMANGDELELGLAAIDALGDIHPADLPSRLVKLRDKSVRDAVRAAAEHAIVTTPKCR